MKKGTLDNKYSKQKPTEEEMESFEKAFIPFREQVMEQVKANQKETEDFIKNLIIQFLHPYYNINSKGGIDLVIRNGKESGSSVGVLIEVKRPANKSEMVSKKNLNVKALHELVYYYVKEREKEKELRRLIITNAKEWFVFDAQDFDKLFYKNTELREKCNQFDKKQLSFSDTDSLYKEFIKPEIDKIQSKIKYDYFDIEQKDPESIACYNFFHPSHLLKLSSPKDRNRLDKRFYDELFHILGLEEVKMKNKKSVVEKKSEDKKDMGSIIENTIEKLKESDIRDKISKLPYIKEQYGERKRTKEKGESDEDRLYRNIALDLSITWINRILFLKLLEIQILKYNKDYPLFAERIKNYSDLNNFFFNVMAREEKNRKDKGEFKGFPYLNSSLFEPTELESATIDIKCLQPIKIDLYSKSVLKNEKKTLEPLNYLFKFLDHYGFNDENNENGKGISPSLLGSLFEKINNYEDGSYYTPNFVTMFMCEGEKGAGGGS